MYGFIKNGEEPCIYKWANGFVIIFLILYVEDILLIKNNIPILQGIKVWLSSQFSMKDLREAAYILGMKIYRDRSKRLLRLSQSTYVDTILKWFSIENFKKDYLSISHEFLSLEELSDNPLRERAYE